MIRTVSISMIVLKPFSERPERGTRKLPAAPIPTTQARPKRQIRCFGSNEARMGKLDPPQMTKSILLNFSMVFLTASFSSSGLRTSAWAWIHTFPVAFDSSLAASVIRSKLYTIQHVTWHVERTRREPRVYRRSSDDRRISTVFHLWYGFTFSLAREPGGKDKKKATTHHSIGHLLANPRPSTGTKHNLSLEDIRLEHRLGISVSGENRRWSHIRRCGVRAFSGEVSFVGEKVVPGWRRQGRLEH